MTETGCIGRGYQVQGHRPSTGLVQAPHQGVTARRCVCVSHACCVMIMWLHLALAKAQGGGGTDDFAWHRVLAEQLVRWAYLSTASGSGGG